MGSYDLFESNSDILEHLYNDKETQTKSYIFNNREMKYRRVFVKHFSNVCVVNFPPHWKCKILIMMWQSFRYLCQNNSSDEKECCLQTQIIVIKYNCVNCQFISITVYYKFIYQQF